MTLDGLVNMYTDARGSVVDQAAENKNKGLCASVDKFMAYLAKTLDNPNAKPGDPMSDCAYVTKRKAPVFLTKGWRHIFCQGYISLGG